MLHFTYSARMAAGRRSCRIAARHAAAVMATECSRLALSSGSDPEGLCGISMFTTVSRFCTKPAARLFFQCCMPFQARKVQAVLCMGALQALLLLREDQQWERPCLFASSKFCEQLEAGLFKKGMGNSPCPKLSHHMRGPAQQLLYSRSIFTMGQRCSMACTRGSKQPKRCTMAWTRHLEG